MIIIKYYLKLLQQECFLCGRFAYILSALLVSLSMQPAYADEERWLPQSVQIHGFLSQGFITTTDNNFFGDTDNNISTDFRELGINGSWRALPDLQLALQVVWRDAGQTDESGVRIDYGLADYNFYSTEATTLGIKAGRVPTPFGLYNDTRDVASTRPGILLPQSIYFDRNRNLAISGDGGYIYGEQRTGYGDLSLDLGVISPRFEDPEFRHALAGNLPGKIKGDATFVSRLMYEWQSGVVRLAVTYLNVNAHFAPDPAPVNLSSGTFSFRPWYFSAQYNAEKWSLTAEYALRNIRLNGFGLFPDADTTGESFYLQGIYHFTSYLQGMIRYDDFAADRSDRHGRKYAAATGRPDYTRFAQDWTFGLRVEVLPKLLVSAEYHNVNGSGWLAGIENPEGTKQHWHLFALMVSYDF